MLFRRLFYALGYWATVKWHAFKPLGFGYFQVGDTRLERLELLRHLRYLTP